MFLREEDFYHDYDIEFDENKLMKISKFRKSFNKCSEKKSNVLLAAYLRRKVVESPLFWNKAGKVIENSKHLKLLKYSTFFCNCYRFNSNIYKENCITFENEVLRKVPKEVKIGIRDIKQVHNKSDEITKWIKDYNIQYYHAYNISCLQHFSEAENLKVVRMHYFPSCEEKNLDMFLQLKYLHSLQIYFYPGLM